MSPELLCKLNEPYTSSGRPSFSLHEYSIENHFYHIKSRSTSIKENTVTVHSAHNRLTCSLIISNRLGLTVQISTIFGMVIL